MLCVFGVYEYVSINGKTTFGISQISWNGETKLWTDNSLDNTYDIKFQVFNGTDLKAITSEKSAYDMKIDSTVDNGILSIKIYNNKKILFNKSGPINKTVSISKADSTNVRIELTGKAAKGHIIIKLS